MQGLDDIGTHRHTADLLDLTPGDRLAIGDQCQCLQQGPGVFLRAFLPQPGNPGAETLAHLVAKSAGDFLQLETPSLAALGRLLQGRANGRVVRALGLLEQLTQLCDRQRFAGRQQGALDNLHQTNFRHLNPPLP